MKKTCKKCKVEKDISRFYRAKGGKHGAAAACKICMQSYGWSKNKEKQITYLCKWVSEHGG